MNKTPKRPGPAATKPPRVGAASGPWRRCRPSCCRSSPVSPVLGSAAASGGRAPGPLPWPVPGAHRLGPTGVPLLVRRAQPGPLAARRAQLDLYVRWCQEVRQVKPSTAAANNPSRVTGNAHRTCCGTPFVTTMLDAGVDLRRADRRPARRPTHHHALRPGPQEPRPAPQLHPRRLHGIQDLTRRASGPACEYRTFEREATAVRCVMRDGSLVHG
jgi:hypothetical protein